MPLRTALIGSPNTRQSKAIVAKQLIVGKRNGRHGATSEMLASGVAPTVVQKQMRHSDARITLGIYGHVVGDAQRRAVENHAEHIEKYAVQ
jgi:integrase